jgi:hypothetical protein
MKKEESPPCGLSRRPNWRFFVNAERDLWLLRWMLGTTFAMTEKSSCSLMGFEICGTVYRLFGATVAMILVLMMSAAE